MGQAKYVLENKNGQIVRVFAWDSNESITLVFREDTNRVEAADVASLKEQEIPFQILLTTKKTQVEKKAVNVEGVGTLRLLSDENEKFSPNYVLAQDDSNENFKTIFKRSAIAQIAISLMLVGAGAYFGTKQATESTTVTIIPQEAVEKMIQKETQQQQPEISHQKTAAQVHKVAQPKVVAPIDSKHPQRKIAKGKARGGFKGPGPKGFGTNEPNMNSMGALNALDHISKTGRGNGGYGGTNMAAVGKGAGSGAGGKGYGGFGSNGGGGHGKGGIGGGGKMGLANSMYGKGLIAAPAGNGSPAPGYGGYGTRGRAGGGEAGVGYGRTSLVGSSKGLGPKGNGPAGSGGGGSGYGWADAGDEDDMTVQGGLTLEQIEAVIMRNIGQITYCYEQGLQSKPSLSGRVRVKFLIGQQGRVTTAGVTSSSIKSAKVESCIINKLQAWNFPHPVGGVSVKVGYPFTLRRVGQN